MTSFFNRIYVCIHWLHCGVCLTAFENSKETIYNKVKQNNPKAELVFVWIRWWLMMLTCPAWVGAASWFVIVHLNVTVLRQVIFLTPDRLALWEGLALASHPWHSACSVCWKRHRVTSPSTKWRSPRSACTTSAPNSPSFLRSVQSTSRASSIFCSLLTPQHPHRPATPTLHPPPQPPLHPPAMSC